MRMLTTGDCARILNLASDAPGGYTAAYILAEVDDDRLPAQINEARATRRRVRIHPEAFAKYLLEHHARVAPKALHHPALVA